MFDLNKALAAWRRALTYNRVMSDIRNHRTTTIKNLD